MTWPFRCGGCKAKDSEIAKLWALIGSMTTIHRETTNIGVPLDALRAGVAGLPFEPRPIAWHGEAGHTQEHAAASFSRNPIQSFIPPDDDNDDAQGVPV